MSNTARTLSHLSLVPPPVREAPANETTRVSPPAAPRSDRVPTVTQSGSRPCMRPRFLYGDSTPFPHDCDFIDVLHHAVACGVALMKAHHAISRASARMVAADRMRREERAALLAISDVVQRSVGTHAVVGSEVARRTASRAVTVTRAVVERDIAAVEAEAERATAAATAMLEDARTATITAIEALATAHDLPGTDVALRLRSGEGAYEAVAIVATPYGVEAAFALAVPEAHAWSEPRRVCDFEDDVQVHVPRAAGWFSRRVERTRVKLGKLYVRDVSIDAARCALVLSKGAQGPRGVLVELDPRNSMRVLWSEIPEAGATRTAASPYELGVDDAAVVLRLWRTIQRSARDLSERRVHMTRALFDGKPLASQDPLAVCDRLVRALEKTTREIAVRAGAPGELVLRRDAGARRRDEIYITKAELTERIETLPPALRRVFDPLDLEGAPRSPRAPAPSLAAFTEISDDDILEDA